MAQETEDKPLDLDLVTAGVRHLFDDEARGFYLIAEREGAAVGQLMVTFEWSDWRDGVFWWIQSVFVAKEHRRTGVYRALYDAVVDRAKQSGDVCGIRLYVERDNEIAQQTYADLGMHETHYRMYEVELERG
jgi:GNAT superfamily N-acetyltransferase